MTTTETRTAIVTGGTSGIGRATAALLRAEGWRVVATGLTEAEVEAAGGEAEVLDVTDDAAVAALFARFDRLDGLVTAAGMVARDAEWQIESFARVIDVNLTGTMRAAIAARPALKRAGGAVVTIASIMGYVSNPKAPAYAASKAGVVNLTRALAARWAEDGIRVNAVAPGYIETAMTEVVRADNAMADALLQRQKLGRWGRPGGGRRDDRLAALGQGELRHRLDPSGRWRLPDQLSPTDAQPAQGTLWTEAGLRTGGSAGLNARRGGSWRLASSASRGRRSQKSSKEPSKIRGNSASATMASS